jgi:hypothetical protein
MQADVICNNNINININQNLDKEQIAQIMSAATTNGGVRSSH